MSQGCRRSVRLAVLLLGTLPALLFASGCTPTQIIAFNDRLNRPPIFFSEFVGQPELSPDGRLVVVPVLVRGISGSVLAVIDVDSGKLQTFASPGSEHWYGPSFSPTGDRIVFIRGCTRRCKGVNAYQVSLLDLKTGLDTAVTVEDGFARRAPAFSPDGRFVAYGALKRAYDNRFARLEYSHWFGLYTRKIRILDLETGIEHTLPLKEFGLEWNGPVMPEGFLDEKTLVINASWPTGHSALIEKVKKKSGDKLLRHRHSYTVTFDRPFKSASPLPTPVAVDLLAAKWVQSDRLGVSSDSRTMVLRNGYNILVGDTRKIRHVTYIGIPVTDAAISKSGNRVAYFVKKDRYIRELWILDIPTGKVWEIGLRERLREGYLSDRSGS